MRSSECLIVVAALYSFCQIWMYVLMDSTALDGYRDV